MTDNNFAQRIKQVRGSMTQEEFSQKCGISRPALANYETKGRLPQAEELRKISTATGVSTDWLLTGQGEMYRGTLVSYQTGQVENVATAREPAMSEYLSNDEVKLVEGFRKLSDKAKKTILDTLDLLKD